MVAVVHAQLDVAVVVPMRNEASSVGELIDSLRRQTLAPAEVILVDGGSTDGTADLARRLTADDARFRVIEAGEATPGRGRNVGIAASHHEWIALVDAGMRVEPTWLERLARVVEQDPSVRIVYGNVETIGDTRFERYAAIAYVAPKRARDGGLMRAPQIHSSLVHVSVWRAVGGFPDLRTSEDLFFMERVQARGTRTGWAPEATVWWHLQPSLRRTFDRFVLYSRHNVWAGRAYDWQYGTARQYVIALVFISLAVLHNPWWLAAVALGFAARTGRSIWRHREGRGLWWALNPVQFISVAFIIFVVDMATFLGWAQAILWRSARPIPQPAVIDGAN